MSNFIVQFPLKTEIYQEDILNKRFEIGRKIYNSLVTATQKRYKEMIKTKIYRSIKAELKEIYQSKDKVNLKRKTELCKQLNEIYKQYNLNEYSFHSDVKNMQKHFKDNIDSFTAQKIATNLWKAYDKLLFGNGNSIHYKKYDTFNSFEGKSNSTGIRFKDNNLIWNGLNIPVIIDYKNPYESQALESEVAYCRIVRKFVRNKYKFYLQIVFKGIAPIKINKQTGEVKHTLGNGNIGIDIGTQTVAYSSKTDVKIYELADRVQNIEKQKRILLRKLDRSRRACNPNNYNEDGTIKRGIKLVWNKSNKYIKTQNELREIQRKQACIRKQSHEKLANHILTLGDRVLVETMQFQGLQKRAKNTTINKNGKFNKKKRFGKSLANKAPAMLIEIINRKLKYNGLEILKINTQKVKASQYNHFIDDYNKKELSDRWNESIEIQRDIYSAFIIMNVNDDLETINKQLCNDTYDNFKILHDEEINRLKKLKANGYKLISSMGI